MTVRHGAVGLDPLPAGNGAMEQAVTDFMSALLHILPADPSADPHATAGAVALVRGYARGVLAHVDAPSVAGAAAQLQLSFTPIGSPS